MGTASRLPREATPTVAEAIGAYRATLDRPETAGTRRVYATGSAGSLRATTCWRSPASGQGRSVSRKTG